MTDHHTWPELDFRCNGGGGCVIVEKIAGGFVIRDSKNPSQPGLVFSRMEYASFRDRVRGDTWTHAAALFAASQFRLLATGRRPLAS